VKLPRDISGEDLLRSLEKYGYKATRQTGSHIRLSSTIKGTEHHITIPRHGTLKIGTLNNIINELASYLELEKQVLLKQLFNK
jgi:predicted RNA binding protein YcfA (HicA-like mRNA interferase family)